ncbi:MBL fold metallo-hydrolase [Myxococcota bacterium]|nr:MBL fold metallo-hydrolase [Myxococcota bacterium]
MCPPSPRLVNGEGSFFGSGKLVCHCLLIEAGEGLVLVDTGLGRGDIERPSERVSKMASLVARPVLDRDETAIAQVERLGFHAKDVRHILLTHGDFDHAGGLSDFPDAEVHVSAGEHEAMTKLPTKSEQFRYSTKQWAHGAKFVAHAIEGETWEGFSAVRAIPGLEPEILMMPLHGHTRGHAGIAVRTKNGWLLHAGDAYFFRGQMDPEKPWIPPGLSLFQKLVDFDRDARVKNQERLRELQRARGADISIFCAHDPIELKREQTRADLGRLRATG